MSRFACSEDFEGGPLYTLGYRKYPFFETRARFISNHYPSPRTVLVAGCGWGFLVEELLVRGYDAWGCDGSPYAMEKAKENLLENAHSQILLCDCTKTDEVLNLPVLAGLSEKQKFDLCITEDVLSCLEDDKEVMLFVSNLRSVVGEMLHIISCANSADPNDHFYQTDGLLWKSHREWTELLCPEKVLNQVPEEIHQCHYQVR